jgi:alanine racemase
VKQVKSPGRPSTLERSSTGNLRHATNRTWAEIDLSAVESNLAGIRTVLDPHVLIMAVVKADGYGHGAVPVARTALRAGASWLGVATVDEGLALRVARITAPILVLGPSAAGAIAEAVQRGLSLTVSSPEAVPLIARGARRRAARVHLKVDTGMTRLGVAVGEVSKVVRTIAAAGVRLEGIFTHLACADEPGSAMTRDQLTRFESILPPLRRRYPKLLVHAANSAAAVLLPRSHYGMVRIGLAMYGLSPGPAVRERVALAPVMRLRSRIVRVVRAQPGTAVSYGATYRVLRPTTIATVACGYADGYPRLAGLNGEVMVDGGRVHIAGRVCMDYLMLDAGDRPLRPDAIVDLFGAGVTVEEVAGWAHTISYEVVCGVGPRVPRVYLDTPGPSVATRRVDPAGHTGTPGRAAKRR